MADALIRVIAKDDKDYASFKKKYTELFPSHAKRAAFVRVRDKEQIYGLRHPTIWMTSAVTVESSPLCQTILGRYGSVALRTLSA